MDTKIGRDAIQARLVGAKSVHTDGLDTYSDELLCGVALEEGMVVVLVCAPVPRPVSAKENEDAVLEGGLPSDGIFLCGDVSLRFW